MGSSLGTTIDPVGRDTNGGTYNFFLQAVLNNEPPASNVNALTADGLVVNAVKQDPNAIGYAGLAWQSKGLKPLKVNGVPCAAEQDQRRAAQVPALALPVPGPARRRQHQPERHWSSSSTGPGAASWPAKSSPKPAASPPSTRRSRQLEEQFPTEYGPKWSDQRVERMLGALVCGVVGLLLALIVTVFVRAWPSFSHNGLAWFGPGGNVDDQLNAIFLSGQNGLEYVYTFHAWPLIWSTILITGGAVLIALFSALFVAVFIVEFAPDWMSNILQPVVRFLASVPSVIYGLIGVVVLVPFIGNHLVTEAAEGLGRRRHLAHRLQPAGGGARC